MLLIDRMKRKRSLRIIRKRIRPKDWYERQQIKHEHGGGQNRGELKPYSGHDTVGMVCLDKYKNIVSGTSTSGLFMKKRGRIGDSPIIGSGLYADSEIGGASATGLGEDIMKGIISYEIIKLMEEGLSPQEACEKAVVKFENKMMKKRGKIGDISVIAMNNKGEWGVATNIENFSFVVGNELSEVKIYRAKRVKNKTKYEPATEEWIQQYTDERMKRN